MTMTDDELRETFYLIVSAEQHMKDAIRDLDQAGRADLAVLVYDWLYEGQGQRIPAARDAIEAELKGDL